MKAEVQGFLDYLRFEKRFSAHTVTAYSTDLEQLAEYLSVSYTITDIREVNHSIIRSWIVKLIEDKVSARSANRKITTLKTFYRYLLREKAVSVNPMLKIQAPKLSKRLPVFVEKPGMENLLEEENFGDDGEGMRNKLIIEMFYATGMRLSELTGLRARDIDLNKMTLKVLGKRSKERIIPIHHTLKDSIRAYSSMKEREGYAQSDFFFHKKGKKLGPKLVYRIVRSYLGLVTTLDKKSPH